MLQEMNTFSERTKLRLIEINTIAVGLGAAAKLMHAWHKQNNRDFFRKKKEFVLFIDDF